MTKDKSRIQSCVDHINTAVDVDPWAKELVAEMGKEILKAQLSKEDATSDLQQTCNQLATDCISRQAAIDALGDEPEVWSGDDEYAQGLNNQWHYDVNSLKAVPSVQPEPCADAVSRNAIIQKLNTMDRYVSEELILCDTDKKFPKNEVFIVDDVYEEIVEQFPPAQPEERTEERTKTHACDLIDRQAAIDAVESMLRRKFGIGGDLAEITLADLPSAQPEDCDTCKHGYFGDDQCERCRVRYPSHYERRTGECTD